MKLGINAFDLAETFFFRDEDGDGWFDYQDCNDFDASINPGATELCNGIDNNCNGLNDDGTTTYTYYRDNDNDGYGTAVEFIDTCILVPPPGFVWLGTDCDDNNNMINPGVSEFCDGIDNDCSGMIDDNLVINTYYLDSDNDGYGSLEFTVGHLFVIPASRLYLVINRLQ